jgi:Domain of unknown function (DUF4926)
MMKFNEYDVVALTEAVPGLRMETHEPIVLQRGAVGTILMDFEGEAYLIDFVDAQGVTYAMETVTGDKLMLLAHEPLLVMA